MAVAALSTLTGAPASAQGTSTEQQPVVVFDSPGVATVTLQACNELGCGTVSREVVVLDPRPAIASVNVPAGAFAGELVTLQAVTSGQPPLDAQWTVSGPLGDQVLSGNPATWTAPAGAVTYQARLELANASGTASAGPVPITVATFADVPASYWSWRFVEALQARGIRTSCATSPARYCPEDVITRGSMALFLLGAQEGGGYIPPACATPAFSDVPCSHPLAPWINELARRGVTAGCGGGRYCPDNPVTRAEMAVFLLATRGVPGWAPTACLVAPFSDVPCSSPFAPWVRQLVVEGVTAGCGPGVYCPTSVITRGQMAVFVTVAFQLPLT
jgi:hypothetical protein